jgi:sporulation protein YabP
MTEERNPTPHQLTLQERNYLTVTGVADVVRFDEDAVILRTSQGTLVVEGTQLQLKTLEGGQAAVEGNIIAMHYAENRQKGGFMHRLFS